MWWLLAVPVVVYLWALVPFELYVPGRCRHRNWELVRSSDSDDVLYMQCQDCGERIWEREQ